MQEHVVHIRPEQPTETLQRLPEIAKASSRRSERVDGEGE